MGTAGNGFKISNDAGATWHQAKLATTSALVAGNGVVVSDFKLATDGSYYFYASSKMYVSANGDDFLADITPTIVASGNRSAVELAVSPSNPNVVYASCINGSSLNGATIQSINKGQSWTVLTKPIPDPFGSGGQGQGFYDNVISVDPKNPYRIFVGGAAFWKWNGDASGNGTWMTAAYQFAFNSNLYVHSDLHVLEWNPFNSNSFIVGGDGGLNRTLNDATSFTPINKGFNVTQAYAIAFVRYPSGGFGGLALGGAMCGNQDNGTTYVSGVFNGPKGSLPVGGGDGNYCDFSHINPSALFSSIYYGQVDRANSPGYLNGSGFEDAEVANYGLKPGTPGFANFVTPIRLWETMSDKTSIDSVKFIAKSVITSIGSGNGSKKVYLTKCQKSNSSAILETMILTLGNGATSTVSVNYTTPSITYVVGSLTKRDYYTTLSSISTTVTATSYAIGDGYDSLKLTFANPPANNLALQVEISQKYLSGADVKVTTKTSQGASFGYALVSNVAAYDSVIVPDIVQARLAVGINGAVYVVKKPLNFSITPDWVQVAGPKSKDATNTNAPYSGEVQTMAWSPNGNHLYVATSSGVLYRISHLHYLIDSVGNKTSAPSVDANYNGINTTGGNGNLNTPIRCTKIGSFGNIITSISVSNDTTSGGSIVVTTGVYNTNPKVYYAANPASLIASANTSNFISKAGSGATGLISGSPVYSSLIEYTDSKRVLVGTEYGLYATNDITVANPIWSKENNNMLPNVPITALRQQVRNSVECWNSGMIYAGSHGRGMWTCNNYYNQTTVGINEIVSQDKTIVNSIKLYPNPAIENVNLSFNVQKSEALTLNVYDLKGILVMTKFLGKLPEGEQLMQINTQDFVSGNYIVSISSDNALVGTNRLVVVK